VRTLSFAQAVADTSPKISFSEEPTGPKTLNQFAGIDTG